MKVYIGKDKPNMAAAAAKMAGAALLAK